MSASPAVAPVVAPVAVLNERLAAVHAEIREHYPFVVRVSVSLHDAASDEIKTFLYSPSEASPLRHYTTQLSAAHWLDELRRTGRSRVLNDLAQVDLGAHTHSQKIRQGGYQASYTVPVFDGETFRGFIFFNSDVPEVFTPKVTRQLDLFVRIISLLVENALRTANTLAGAVHVLREVSRFRDDETASHLSRMSYYSALIARSLAAGAGRDDEWVEHIRLFAPLHDVGKIATPDAILLKPGRLTPEERQIMQLHPVRGETMLRNLMDKLALTHMHNIQCLLHIVRHHHESWDGRGYPDGLAGERIPLEARIVTVADVFDALTSERCYKEAWPVEKAVAYLQRGCEVEFDPQCVDALVAGLPAAREIMARFAESSTEAA